MTIILKNPETGQKHEIDAAARKELAENLAFAEQHGRDQFTFRAMLLDVGSARNILEAEEE